MNKKLFGVLAVLIGAIALTGAAAAFMGFHGQQFLDSDTQNQLKTAIENNDFDAFLKAQETALKQRFDLMVQKNQVQNQLNAAVQSGDFEQWKSVLEQNSTPLSERMLSQINEDNFPKLKELQNAVETGDFETARQIKSELGIGFGLRGHGFGMQGHGNKMHGFNGFQKPIVEG